MRQLCRERSCPYPGRSASGGVLWDPKARWLRRYAVIGQKSAEDENPARAPGKGPRAV